MIKVKIEINLDRSPYGHIKTKFKNGEISGKEVAKHLREMANVAEALDG